MKTEWIVIEIIAVAIDCLTIIYFLNSRFLSKNKSIYPQVTAWLCLFSWGIIATFLRFPIILYEVVEYLFALVYLSKTKHGSFWQKLFGVLLTLALFMGSSIAGAGVASIISNVNVEHTLIYQDSARLLAVTIIKTIQLILFFVLAKKHNSFRQLQKKPFVVLACMTIMIFISLQLLFSNLTEFSEDTIPVLIWLAALLLLTLVGVFVMYELFTREERENIELSTRLQRLELESHFFREVDVMLSDLRTWRHEYNNNLIALRALSESNTNGRLLEYLDKLSVESLQESTLLQTGNTVLDAVVSSKLMLARSSGIEVSIHAVYLENNVIDDNDLCAIAGNLLDNAVEACERMKDVKQHRFISFSLLIKGRNLVLSILNSYDGEIKRIGNRFMTIKNNPLHGVGIQYVDSIVDKYQGHVLREYQNGVFETHVMLPLVSAKGADTD